MLKATLTLLAGGALAQALPLALGPWLTRLYTPAQFGQYAVFAALAANLAVVACARYDYALPLARDDAEARALLALCARVLLAVSAATLLLSAVLGASGVLNDWAWLAPAVLAAGAVQCLGLWAARAERFKALAVSRVVQHGGGALAQVAAGVASSAGSAGLVAGPVLGAAAALAWLRHPAPAGGWRGLLTVPRAQWTAAARRHRQFPLLNTPHAFAGALQDTLAVALIVAWSGEPAAGFWGLALRYLKAPATLVGGAVSQALYPRLARSNADDARAAVRQVMVVLAGFALPLVALSMLFGPTLFAHLFGEPWREAGELARALAPYIGLHFVASPLAVVTLAWAAQGWALRLALVGQVLFIAALAIGLQLGGLLGAAWAVSIAMAPYFAWYFLCLATWKEVPHAAAA